MSGLSQLTLEGDGIIENLFHYLWCKDELECGPEINIPDTVVYKYRQPALWYFTSVDGTLKKKSKANITNVHIEEAFFRKDMGCDIVAYYICDVPNEESTGEDDAMHTTIEYFDKKGLHDFLYKREKVNNGVLQRFIEPKVSLSLLSLFSSAHLCTLPLSPLLCSL